MPHMNESCLVWISHVTDSSLLGKRWVFKGGFPHLLAQAEIMDGGWWNFWGWWNFIEQLQISPPNIRGGGNFAHREQTTPPDGSCAQSCGGHSCRRSVQALAHMPYHVPSMDSCSQFCWILHPHRIAVLFPPAFVSPWRKSFVQIHAK